MFVVCVIIIMLLVLTLVDTWLQAVSNSYRYLKHYLIKKNRCKLLVYRMSKIKNMFGVHQLKERNSFLNSVPRNK